MSQTSSGVARNEVSIPAHVDPRLVVDFDYQNPPGFSPEGEIHQAWRRLHDGPDIFWTPRHGGHWVLTRAEDIAWAQETYQIFSHREFMVPRASTFSLPPITLDPPDNLPYRAVLTPSFTPKQVREVHQPKVRALTVELIEGLKSRGGCEFVREFASVMPVNIFLGIASLPLDRREEFLGWAHGQGQPGAQGANARALIAAYLGEAARARGPGEDLLGRIAAALDDPRFENKDEVVNMAMLVFLGGLDTVASLLSFVMCNLAKQPDLQRRLREHPAIVPEAVEECLRRHGVSTTSRLVVAETRHKGAHFMSGEMVMVPSIIAGLDDRRHPDPMRIDFDRKDVPHATFGNGPHRCLGQFLARMELQIFLEEWFARVPEVRLDPDLPPLYVAGSVCSMARLNLVWDRLN